MKSELPNLIHEGEVLEVLSILGSGGSKTVLEVSLEGLKRAIAIPNRVDTQDVIDKKWQSTLEEQSHAEALRDSGLLVNPTYEVRKMVVEGVETDVLAMTPFSELSFEVYDGKSTNQTWEKGPLSHINSYEELHSLLGSVSSDIRKLTSMGIVLPRDGISFAALPDNTLRLFLFDLEGMTTVENYEQELKKFYSRVVVDKLDNLLDHEQFMRFEQQGYDFAARQKLVSQLISDLTLSE